MADNMSNEAKETGFERIAVVGAGSMGTNMSLLFASKGHKISLFDISKANIQSAEKAASSASLKLDTFTDYQEFTDSLSSSEPNLYIFSITHGPPADEVLSELKSYLKKGDIIVDGGNEWYLNTRRRGKELSEMGVGYIGTGVSGGYQSARRGPSISPGGEEEVVEKVMPFFERIAAKDEDGNACVARMGPEGSGHYVKMVHNGIEQGELSGISEVFALLKHQLDYSDDEIGNIFGKWNSDGELKDNFLINISHEICLRKENHKHTLDRIQDKVVQDADNSEGTGFWTVSEAAQRHVSCPTIACAHFLRVASADRAERIKVAKLINGPDATKTEKRGGITEEDLRIATYGVLLASYIQGLNLLARTSRDEKWNVSLASCIRIWRAGCIIQSTALANFLEPLLKANPDVENVLLIPEISKEMGRCYPALKKVVIKALEWDASVPAISATCEWLKYIGDTLLPTDFEEAMLDYFGAHAYDLKSEGAGTVKKGSHHTEWKPA